MAQERKTGPAARARLGGREQALLGFVVAAAVLGIVVLVVIGRSDLGADGVVVTVVLGVALMQAVTLAGLVYVVRAVRRDAIKSQRFSERVDRSAKGTRDRLTRLEQAAKLQKTHHDLTLDLGKQMAADRKEAQRQQLAGQRQVQALLNLKDLVRLEAAAPPAGGWAASADLLLFCVDRLLEDKPQLVVECGSGLSTLFLSLAIEQHGLPTRVVALEHNADYAAKTQAVLERHGVAHRADVRVAPLERTSLADHETHWYSEAALDGLDQIGMLLVDGPPSTTGSHARYPAVPLLRDHFAARCTIVVDDLNRVSDQETVELWTGLLPDFSFSISKDFEKHIGLLERR
ncbi:class I SAM-dependent methyltransferase [Nocardioides marmorisolisilvae]|uniref:Class I SAM-dependent methyltransferase n=1 Tax=Nocardioides marmorisolisilvae TaxID=1542737 RepID=A0A3N0DZG2_9ACTN|nr:class I SAM-dependent methyltransferase [Nocardioides marmorisolisilvae]RNL80984.1 class I SAM-dependent methyltransferase [Nocardioides marmorisolisilvae]